MRFGGSVEPLVWGNFNLYKGTKRLYLKSVDVSEDFWALRRDPERLRILLEWDRLLSLHLVPGHPCDDVLAIFYWSSILVRQGVHPLLAEWRFLWKWLNAWGLAPSLEQCVTCGTTLANGHWTATGLQCDRCGRGSSIPADVLRQFRIVAGAPIRELEERSSAAVEGEEIWRDGCRRLKMFLEYVR
jgi:DNA repair protein RecO (recombination protein O)